MALKTIYSMWLLIRLAALILVGIASPFFFQQMHQEFEGESPSWTFILALLAATITMVLFAMFLQRVNPLSTEKWLKPSWNSNLAGFRQPLQVFHFGGWIFIVLGISVALYTIWIGSRNLFFLLPLTIGIGIMSGVKLSELLFRDRFIK